MTDLRVQLHKKRRLQKPRIEVHDDASEDEDDKDSLENARVSDVDEDDPVPSVRQRQVSNRIVQKTGSPRKVNIEPEKSKIRYVILSFCLCTFPILISNYF